MAWAVVAVIVDAKWLTFGVCGGGLGDGARADGQVCHACNDVRALPCAVQRMLE